MNPQAALRFFVVMGAVLMVTGTLMFVARPRQRPELGLAKFFNRSTVWAGFCVAAGLLAVLVGLGILPLARLPQQH